MPQSACAGVARPIGFVVPDPLKSSRRRAGIFEHHREPLAPIGKFVARVVKSFGLFSSLIVVSLALGVVGYHTICGLGWVDSILNASMILTGMGPVAHLDTNAGKLFASAYATFSGVAFLTSIGVLVAPILHRFMHRFHLEEDDGES